MFKEGGGGTITGGVELGSVAQRHFFRGEVQRVRELVEVFRYGVNELNAMGQTPLHIAAALGRADLVAELLRLGAKANASVGVSAPLLERGAAADARANGGWTPLVIAGENGHVAVLRELLKHGADVNARAKDGRTALHGASYKGRTELVRELLKHPAVHINAQDADGLTPLMETCLKGHVMAATLLVEHGADLALLNNGGQSALRLAEDKARNAAWHGAGEEPLAAAPRADYWRIVALLRERGAT